jgi:hypothetical protein
MSFSPYVRGGRFNDTSKAHFVEGPSDIPVVMALGTLRLARFLIQNEYVVSRFFPEVVIDTVPEKDDDHTFMEMTLPNGKLLVFRANSICGAGVSLVSDHKSQAFSTRNVNAGQSELEIGFTYGANQYNMELGRHIEPRTVGMLWKTASELGSYVQWIHDEIALGRGLPNEA